MQIVHAERMPWGENLAAHRQGRMAHKVLFEGEEGRPDNFAWVMANEGADYFSPRHRHAWDQVRLCLHGSIPIGKNSRLNEGEVGYFPEGVPYGPQEGGPDRLTLVLQVGGASGQGYLSARQMREARAELARDGVFEGGVFKRTSGGGRTNLDAYEAIWRHVTGAPIDYPRPRAKSPILLDPEAFAWRDDAAFAGVRRKSLGRFSDVGPELQFVSVPADGLWRLEASADRRLVFVRAGRGAVQGEEYEPHAALRFEPGESAEFRAAEATEFFIIGLQTFPAASPGPT